MFKYMVLKKLKKVINILHQIVEKENVMSEALDTLTLEVRELETVVDSAIALINGLAAQLRAIADDPAAILALAAELDAKEQELAAAVVANTPPTP
jgi:hypothetical protein